MPFFVNHQLEIYEPSDTGELNPYHEPIQEYNLVESVNCDLQSTHNSDILLESGEILTDTYHAYISADTRITQDMKFKIDDNTYTLIGREVVNSRFTATQHIRLLLQIDRKACL